MQATQGLVDIVNRGCKAARRFAGFCQLPHHLFKSVLHSRGIQSDCPYVPDAIISGTMSHRGGLVHHGDC